MTLVMDRRTFLAGLAAAPLPAQTATRIIDIHQHTDYSGRPDGVFLNHQDTMGIAKTVLLPAGSRFNLEAGASGNDRVVEIAKRFPDRYVFFANEVPYDPQAKSVLEKYLRMGAKGIGEQKFFVDVNSAPVDLICSIAQDHGVPILLHFQHERYNVNFDQFWRVLQKYHRVNFIGHAQTWWANIDAAHEQPVLYPRWKVTAGGWTDRYLRDYANMYGDLSAGSGLNALARDEAHAREFLNRHQDKLLYGSDCSDHLGQGPKCSGSQQIAQVKRLTSPEVRRKIFWENAARVIGIS
jgi:predicted TIM-barrel fold metal-dependent hydrolase